MPSTVLPIGAAGMRSARKALAPFVEDPTTDMYFPSQGHEEVIARLMYLVEENDRCGIVTGSRGVGKSTVLIRVGQLIRRAGWRVRRIDLAGLDHQALIHRLAVEMGCNPAPTSDIHDLWDQIDLAISAAARVQQPWVLLCDHADRLRPGALSLVENLLHSPHSRGLILLLAHRDSEDSLLLRSCREHCGLRVELPPLTIDETQAYIDHSLDRGLISTPEFTRDAIQLIARISGGNPQKINRICRAAVLTANAECRPEIESDLVLSVTEELLALPTMV